MIKEGSVDIVGRIVAWSITIVVEYLCFHAGILINIQLSIGSNWSTLALIGKLLENVKCFQFPLMPI